MDRLYMSRKEGGRGLTSVQKMQQLSKLDKCMKKNQERLITVVSNSYVYERPNKMTAKLEDKNRKEKQLYGYFKR